MTVAALGTQDRAMHLLGLLSASALALAALVSCGKPPAVEPAASPSAAATAEPAARGCSLRFTDIEQGRFEARLLCRGADRCRVLLNACLDKSFETPFVDGALVIGEDASNVAPCQVGMSGDLKCVGLDATKLIEVPEGAAARFRLSVPECNAGNQTPYSNPKIARDCAAHADDPLEQGVVFAADARGLVREWRGARVDDLQGLKAEAAREAERLAKEAEAEAAARRKKAL
ncbi:MAG: hypothetical protein IT373_21340, partial [Polyangiaceae bacterium]|nr:hypothetical protein [Polyangiaceae bacterium]